MVIVLTGPCPRRESPVGAYTAVYPPLHPGSRGRSSHKAWPAGLAICRRSNNTSDYTIASGLAGMPDDFVPGIAILTTSGRTASDCGYRQPVTPAAAASLGGRASRIHGLAILPGGIQWLLPPTGPCPIRESPAGFTYRQLICSGSAGPQPRGVPAPLQVQSRDHVRDYRWRSPARASGPAILHHGVTYCSKRRITGLHLAASSAPAG